MSLRPALLSPLTLSGGQAFAMLRHDSWVFESTYLHKNPTPVVVAYYGYRYYAAADGRWVSRDPIGERGGFNLFTLVRNAPVLTWDYLGREEKKTEGAKTQAGLINAKTIYPIIYQGKAIGTLRVTVYKSAEKMTLNAGSDFYGADIQIEPSIKARDLPRPCILRWRQRVTGIDQAGNFLKEAEGIGKGELLKDHLDPLIRRNGKEWYYDDIQRKQQEVGPAEKFSDSTRSRSQAYLVGNVNRVTFTYKAELVEVTDITQKDQGIVTATVIWGFWMSTGNPPSDILPLTMEPAPPEPSKK